MRYYISDLHFFHESMNTRMDNRGFPTVEEMNEYMVNAWNLRVNRGDEVVILGDLSIGKRAETETVLKRLKGKKYLVTGNHDKFLKDKDFDQSLFANIQPYMEMNDNKRKVILCHYPVFCYNGQYKKESEKMGGVYMLHGHVHDTYDQVLVDRFTSETKQVSRTIRGEMIPIQCNILNCFCKWSDYIPWTLDEWIAFHKERLKTGFPKIQDAV